ncbi:MAG TPA: type II toxin-antitoxin system HipA family toxin [Steroidobacteraceae bacterium]|nr:type II toxin-antitoxin system HipA family toxin [Steroidobacteraceae bacterium]
MPRRYQPRALAVWANGLRVGTWRLPARASMEFEYHEQWLDAPEGRPLSLSLPLAAPTHAHRGKVVEAYFDNLLPDSEAIRRRLQARFHTASGGAFDLLSAIGRDCVGAVQILPADEAPDDVRKIEHVPLADSQIEKDLAGVASPTTMLNASQDFRISIAGAQEKTAFLLHRGKWCRPIGSTPTTHIFKLPLGLVGNRQADFRTSVENEWLCAQILAAFGLPVARCELGQFGAQTVLVVQRFDRQLHSSGGYWLRLMQEDLAQATGTPWHRKYQADGGPGVADIARILRVSVEAKADLTTLFQSQVLFWMLAATDGHAKNFSLRILEGGAFRLTPLYDVLSAWPVIGKKANELPIDKLKMAMAVPGERPHYLWKAIGRRHFEVMGKKLGFNTEAPVLIDELVDKTDDAIKGVERKIPRDFPGALFERISAGLKKSAEALKKQRNE